MAGGPLPAEVAGLAGAVPRPWPLGLLMSVSLS